MQSDGSATSLWPNADYYQAVKHLRRIIGQAVYLTEIQLTAINAGVSWSDTPLRLLAVIDFPEPNPYRQLYPHLVILEDGRGINLGQIARISLERAFAPDESQIIYANKSFLQEHVYAPRRLSHALLRETSHVLLADILQATAPTNVEWQQLPNNTSDSATGLTNTPYNQLNYQDNKTQITTKIDDEVIRT